MPTDDWLPGLDLLLERFDGPMRVGLVDALREAIRSGRLTAGTRLPASRSLAADLGLGRNTVVRAYTELISEGWLSARHGSATTVSSRAGDGVSIPSPRPNAVRSARRPVHDLRPGHPDLSSFPRQEWIGALTRAVSGAPVDAFGYAESSGRVELREVLSGYLTRARGLNTSADNVVVCSGAADGLRLVAAALVERGVKQVAVEDFGLPTQRAALARAGLLTPSLPIDGDGADVSVLDRMPNVGAVLVTPSHQFPLGVRLHPRRRAAVIDWARRRAALVIEDDYDGEFQYERTVVGALQGLDRQRVIYLGTASKSLAPGLRLGWIVVPDHLVDAVVAQKTDAIESVGFVEQLAMAQFIESGSYDRHVRRMRSQYRRRRAQLVEAVAHRSPNCVVSGMAAGLHVRLELPRPTDGATTHPTDWRRLAVEPLDRFRHPESTSVADGVIVGFAAPSPSALAALLDLLP